MIMSVAHLIVLIFTFLFTVGRAQHNKSCLPDMNIKIRFDQMTSVLYTYDEHWQASHIEDDKANPNGLLISSYSRVMTFDITSSEITTIFGGSKDGHKEYPGNEAEFNDITGFRQIDNVTILAVDSRNHCIRLLDRVRYTTKSKLGTCKTANFTDGVGQEACFKIPYFIIDGQYKHEYFITDRHNNAIRTYDHSTGYVGTLIRNIVKPKEMVLNQNRTLLFVTVSNNGVVKVNISSKLIEQVYQFRLSTYGITRLPHTPYLMVTHRSHHRITMFTESGDTLENVCEDGYAGHKNGDISNCMIKEPSSVRFSFRYRAILIGGYYSIRRLTLSYGQNGTVCDINEENSKLPSRPAVVVTPSPSTITNTSEISQLNNTDLTSPEISTDWRGDQDKSVDSSMQMREIVLICSFAGVIILFALVTALLITKLRQTKSGLKQAQQVRPLPDQPVASERSASNPYESLVVESVASSISYTHGPIRGDTALPPRRINHLRQQARPQTGNSAPGQASSRTSRGSSNEAYQHMSNAYSGGEELQMMLRMELRRRTQERMALTLANHDMENDTYNTYNELDNRAVLPCRGSQLCQQLQLIANNSATSQANSRTSQGSSNDTYQHMSSAYSGREQSLSLHEDISSQDDTENGRLLTTIND